MPKKLGKILWRVEPMLIIAASEVIVSNKYVWARRGVNSASGYKGWNWKF